MSKKVLFILIGLVVVGLSTAMFAQAALVPCENDCELSDLVETVFIVINFLLSAAGVVALLFVVIGGVKMMLSGGNPEQIKSGKATLFSALIGLVMVFMAYLIINTVVSLIPGLEFDSFQGLRNLLPGQQP